MTWRRATKAVGLSCPVLSIYPFRMGALNALNTADAVLSAAVILAIAALAILNPCSLRTAAALGLAMDGRLTSVLNAATAAFLGIVAGATVLTGGRIVALAISGRAAAVAVSIKVLLGAWRLFNPRLASVYGALAMADFDLAGIKLGRVAASPPHRTPSQGERTMPPGAHPEPGHWTTNTLVRSDLPRRVAIEREQHCVALGGAVEGTGGSANRLVVPGTLRHGSWPVVGS